MILRSIKLENIRSYTLEVIQFPQGPVLLSGDIGSGKSTILLGIEFALFGIMRAELSGQSLLRHGTTSGSVELSFSVGENNYVIKRSLKKSKEAVVQDSGFLITDGRKYEGTPVELKSRILSILGYPEELVTRSKSLIYRYTVYTPQEEMKQILFEDKDSRLDTLRKVFGIDKYRSIRENAVIFVRELKHKQSEFEIRIESLAELEKERRQKQERIISLDQEADKINLARKEAEASVREHEEMLLVIEEKISRYKEKKNALGFKEAQIDENRTRLEQSMKRAEESRTRIENFVKKIDLFKDISQLKPEKDYEDEVYRLQEELTKILQHKTAIAEQSRILGEQRSRLEKEIEVMAENSKKAISLKLKLSEEEDPSAKRNEQEQILEEFMQKEMKVRVSLENCKVKIEEAESLIKRIQEAHVCPLCRQNVDDTHRSNVTKEEKSKLEVCYKERDELRAAAQKIHINIDKVKRNIEKLKELEETHKRETLQLASLESSANDLVKKQKELSSIIARLEESKPASSEIPEQLKIAIEQKRKELSLVRDNNLKYREKQNMIEIVKHDRSTLEKLQSDAAKAKLDIDKLALDKSLIEKEIAEYIGIEDEYSRQKMLANQQKETFRQIEISLASLKHEKKLLSENIAEIGKKLEMLEQLKQKIAEIGEILNWFDSFFLNLMSTMEKHIMISIHREFSQLLKEWFSILVENLDISLDDEFSPRIIQDGYETEVDALSGGEKTAVALAYRLALNRVINDLISTVTTKGLIILDEPTDGFSTEQLDRVREVLTLLDMRQTILVSHEPKMETYVESIIRITKSGNISKVSYQ